MRKRNWRGYAMVIGAALLLAAAAETAEGNTGVGCLQSDLTQVTDAYFTQSVHVSAGAAEKMVCLTFDDGPSKNTEPILEILAEESVPATFFVIAAENNEEYLPLVKREAEEGHQVALHSASHEYRQIYANVDAYWADLDTLKEKLKPYIAVDGMHCIRFPGGSTNTISRKYGGRTLMKELKAQAEQKQYRWIDWNVSAEDAVGSSPSANTIFQNVIRDAKGKDVCVVLMHDTARTHSTVQALPDIIGWFKKEGYSFYTVDQMLDRTD